MMAAFSSFHQNPFQLPDSSILPPVSSPSTINKMCGLVEEQNIGSSSFPQFPQPQTLEHLVQSTKGSSGLANNDEASVLSVITNKNSIYSSSVVTDKYPDSFDRLTRNPNPMDKKRKCKQAVSSANCADQSKNVRSEVKGKKQKEMKGCEEEKKSEEEKKAAEAPPAGYIHVRARRGQATDNHSLAERLRREKISARMKQLQALVPGCDKVSGKALMLDEIINYVQSLQSQVEFLSMKLASVDPMFYDFGMELESFMVRPDQNLNSLPSPLEGMQQCSPATANPYTYPYQSSSVNSNLVFQQPQIPDALNQVNRQVCWKVDGQGQKIINQPGTSNSNSLFSFH